VIMRSPDVIMMVLPVLRVGQQNTYRSISRHPRAV
jgi:hypothetical protein